MRCEKGIWPPSNPRRNPSLRAFWPFTPRPEVLPRPEPIPRPTRRRDLRAPSLSLISLSFICTSLALAHVLDAHQMADLPHHPAHGRRTDQHARPLQLVEAAP